MVILTVPPPNHMRYDAMKKRILFLLASSLCLVTAIAQADLISQFTFDNTAANAVAGAPDGIVNGAAAYVTGKVGSGALSLASGQYVDATTAGFPNSSAGLSTATVAFWVMTTNTSSKQCIIGAAESADATTLDIDTNPGGNLELYLRAGNNATLAGNTTAAGGLFDGTWHHVAVTWNATTGSAGSGSMGIYLDGVPLGTTVTDNAITAGDTFSAWDHPVRIAANGRATPNWDPFTGSLDDVRVYNTVLSQGEIATLAGVPEPSTLVLAGLGAFGMVAYAWRKRK